MTKPLPPHDRYAGIDPSTEEGQRTIRRLADRDLRLAAERNRQGKGHHEDRQREADERSQS